MRVASPLFVDSLLPAEVEKNIGIPLPSLGLAGLYPFVFETLKDRDGFLLGHELMNKGAILFDQFQWLDDPMRALNRLSGNLVIVGGTGFGKSTLMKLLIRFYIRTHKDHLDRPGEQEQLPDEALWRHVHQLGTARPYHQCLRSEADLRGRG